LAGASGGMPLATNSDDVDLALGRKKQRSKKQRSREAIFFASLLLVSMLLFIYAAK